MGDGLFNLPTYRNPARGFPALAGRVLAFLAWLIVFVALSALRFVVVVCLRLLRPFILFGMLLAIVGGIGTAIVFAYGYHWQDAMRAAFVVLFSSIVFILYSFLVTKIDPKHFENAESNRWLIYY